MANCKPCEEKGVAKTAFFVINGVPLCPEHRTEKLLGLKKPVDVIETKEEEEKMVTGMASQGLCFCGRPKNHRGIHKGAKMKKEVVAARPKAALRVPRAASKDLGGPIISVIAELEARRDKLQNLIDELKAL